MKGGVTKEKSLAFAVRIVRLYKFLYKQKEFVISSQLLRSGTAIGALIREAEYAESPLDFIHKMSVAQKECNETIYWLELLKETEFLNQEMFDSINMDAIEIMKLITSSIKTKKSNLANIKNSTKPLSNQ